MQQLNELLAQQQAIAAQLAQLVISERENVLADMKSKMKLFGFKYNDFKGVLVQTRKPKEGEAKAATKTKTK